MNKLGSIHSFAETIWIKITGGTKEIKPLVSTITCTTKKMIWMVPSKKQIADLSNRHEVMKDFNYHIHGPSRKFMTCLANHFLL